MEDKGLVNILLLNSLDFDSTIEQLLESIKTTTKRLRAINPDNTYKKNISIAAANYIFYKVEDIPKELKDKTKELVFIGSPIYALSYVPYLKSLNAGKKLSHLFSEEGYFYPENPLSIKEIEIG